MIELIQFIWNMFIADWVMVSCGLIAVISVVLLVKVVVPLIIPCIGAALKSDDGKYWSPWEKAAEALVSKEAESK